MHVIFSLLRIKKSHAIISRRDIATSFAKDNCPVFLTAYVVCIEQNCSHSLLGVLHCEEGTYFSILSEYFTKTNYAINIQKITCYLPLTLKYTILDTLCMGLNRKVRTVYQLQKTLADIDKKLVVFILKDVERFSKLKLKSS